MNTNRRSKIRVACLGHDVYFENHYCEKSSENYEVEWFSFNHFAQEFYDKIISFRPDLTIIYRPELHRDLNLKALPGLKIGFSTEPLPKLINENIYESEETSRRMKIITYLDFSAFNAVFHYDKNSAAFAQKANLPFTGFRRIPINTDIFHPFNKPDVNWDAVFVGKATPRRSRLIQPLKSHNLSLLWVEHGVSGHALAEIFRRSKCVLNIHADDIVALEPRVYLAAACGVPVLSDYYGDERFPMDVFVKTVDMKQLSPTLIRDSIVSLNQNINNLERNFLASEIYKLSGMKFLQEIVSSYI